MKSLTILILVFLVRLTFSCCNCPEQLASYQFDHLSIQNYDHTGWTANRTDYNVMYSAAIAFEITLTDSSFRPPLAIAQAWHPKLSSAMAMQRCECPYHLFLKHEISNLSILTLHDFSPEKPAGSDIVDSFVWQFKWNHLYQSIDSLLPELNEPFYAKYFPEKTYQFFCTDSVQNDSLQLVFQIQYANGEILSDTTEVIAIRISGEEGAL